MSRRKPAYRTNPQDKTGFFDGSHSSQRDGGSKMERLLGIGQVIERKNTYVVIGNIRSKKPYLKTSKLPFGYSIMISHFDNDKIVVRMTVRTPNAVKTIAEIPLNEPLFTRRIEALKFMIELVNAVKEKYGDMIKPMGEERRNEEFDIDKI